MVAAAVIGLVVGIGGTTLVWTLTDDSDPAPGAEGDVTTACSLVQRVTWADKEPGTSIEDYTRWNAATALARTASEKEPRYRPLADALDGSSKIVSQTFKAEGPEFEDNVRKARGFCEDL